MPNTFFCLGCEQWRPANPCLKKQEYCHDHSCQCARKSRWQRAKIKSDAQFRQDQQKNLQDWRKYRPLRDYQRRYREEHPEYVAKNGELQKQRNARRRRSVQAACVPAKIVKIDASASAKTGAYEARNPAPGIVKMDAPTSVKTNLCLELEMAGRIVKIDASLMQAQVSFKPEAFWGAALG